MIYDHYPEYSGPRLTLSYTDPERLRVLRSLPMDGDCVLMVLGDLGLAAYEWAIKRGEKVEHSNCAYGQSSVALRDGLIAYHGLPGEAETTKAALLEALKEAVRDLEGYAESFEEDHYSLAAQTTRKHVERYRSAIAQAEKGAA